MFLDEQTLDIQCPQCEFFNTIAFREIRLRDAIICRGCKSTLQLDDHLNMVRNAQIQIERQLSELSKTITIKL